MAGGKRRCLKSDSSRSNPFANRLDVLNQRLADQGEILLMEQQSGFVDGCRLKSKLLQEISGQGETQALGDLAKLQSRRPKHLKGNHFECDWLLNSFKRYSCRRNNHMG